MKNKPTQRDLWEERVTAHLLGELDAGPSAEVERRLREDPDLAAFARRMRRTLDAVREAVAAGQETRAFEAEMAEKREMDPDAALDPELAPHRDHDPVLDPSEVRLSEKRRRALLRRFRQPARRPWSMPRLEFARYRWVIPVSLAASLMVYLGMESVIRMSRQSAGQARLGLGLEQENAGANRWGEDVSRPKMLAKNEPWFKPPEPQRNLREWGAFSDESAPSDGGSQAEEAPADRADLEAGKQIIATKAPVADFGLYLPKDTLARSSSMAPSLDTATMDAEADFLAQTPPATRLAAAPPPRVPAQVLTENGGLKTVRLWDLSTSPAKAIGEKAEPSAVPPVAGPKSFFRMTSPTAESLGRLPAGLNEVDASGERPTTPALGGRGAVGAGLGGAVDGVTSVESPPASDDDRVRQAGRALELRRKVSPASRVQQLDSLFAKAKPSGLPRLEEAERNPAIDSNPEVADSTKLEPFEDSGSLGFSRLALGAAVVPIEPAPQEADKEMALGEAMTEKKLSVRSQNRDAGAIDLKDATDEVRAPTPTSGTAAQPLPETPTALNAFSTFSLNVSDVSFQLAAASLANGRLPEPGRVRSEEFVNAFDYRDPAPAPGARIGFHWEQAHHPFQHNRDLIRFSVQTAARGREPGRPLNLVLLVDNSGSMERADRVRIIQEALTVLARQLTDRDVVSVVSFARTPRLWIDGMAGGQPEALIERMGQLNPQGGTNLELALDLAYETARKHFRAGSNNRVILLTDGAANLGNVKPADLKRKVEARRLEGLALDCFGVGWEGYNDDLLEVLSRHGDGRYGFLNDPVAAATEFADQLAGALQVAAADVKAQVEFNPDRVTVWRQIGYEKHQLTKEQFRDDTVDAAEIGAAESGTALYAVQVDPAGRGPLGVVRVRFKVPSTGRYQEQEWVLPYHPGVPSLDEAYDSMKLAAVAAGFAEWLAGSPYAGNVTLSELRRLLAGVPERYALDPRPRQLAAMIQQAQRIAGQ